MIVIEYVSKKGARGRHEILSLSLTKQQARRFRKWIQALESKEFPQISAKLRSPRGYCCLGVQCELYSQEVGGFWEFKREANEFDFIADYHEVDMWDNPALPISDYSMPPEPVLKFYGLTDDVANVFAQMNDAGLSFKQIATFAKKILKDAKIS